MTKTTPTPLSMLIGAASIFLMAGPPSAVSAETFSTSARNETDTVYFRSPAKLEFVEGATDNIVGSIDVAADSISAVTGIFQVDLRTLVTGVKLRDQHMRERHLHTEKYPFAYFTISGVSGCPQTLKTDSSYNIQATGKFYIHGGWRPVAVAAEVRRGKTGASGESLSVRARFSLKLDEFGIPRPKALFLKLAETINVEVIFTAANDLPAPAIALPDWPEQK